MADALDVGIDNMDFDDVTWPYYDEYDDEWHGEASGHINTSYEERACSRGCCGYETHYEEIPIKYLFDDNWRETLAADQAQAIEDQHLKYEAERAAKAKRLAAEEAARKAQRHEEYLRLRQEFGGTDG